MIAASDQRCGGCKFYAPDKRPEYAKTQGHCRRYPPQLVWTIHDGINGDWGQDWPYMSITDFCGEFVEADPAALKQQRGRT